MQLRPPGGQVKDGDPHLPGPDHQHASAPQSKRLRVGSSVTGHDFLLGASPPWAEVWAPLCWASPITRTPSWGDMVFPVGVGILGAFVCVKCRHTCARVSVGRAPRVGCTVHAGPAGKPVAAQELGPASCVSWPLTMKASGHEVLPWVSCEVPVPVPVWSRLASGSQLGGHVMLKCLCSEADRTQAWALRLRPWAALLCERFLPRAAVSTWGFGSRRLPVRAGLP